MNFYRQLRYIFCQNSMIIPIKTMFKQQLVTEKIHINVSFVKKLSFQGILMG